MRIKMWLQDRKTSGIESRENFFRSAGKELAVAAATAQWPTWRSNREPDSFSNLGLESQEQWNLVSTVPVNDPSALLYDLDNDGQQVLVPAKTLRSFQDVRAMPNAAGNCYASWVSLEISQPELSRYALWYRFWGQRDRERDGERGRGGERETLSLCLCYTDTVPGQEEYWVLDWTLQSGGGRLSFSALLGTWTVNLTPELNHIKKMLHPKLSKF